MVRTRAVPRRRPNVNVNPRQMRDVDFQAQRVAATIKNKVSFTSS